MVGLKSFVGLAICALILALCVSAQDATSKARSMKDLEAEVLKVITDNTNATMRDLVPKLHAQTAAAIASLKENDVYPTKAEIDTSVKNIVDKIPPNSVLSGDNAVRFQRGITGHLTRSFPSKSAK